MVSCVICSSNLKRGQDDSITCVTCNNLFHLKCIPLKKEDVTHSNNIKKIWSCKDCLKKPKTVMSDSSKLVSPTLPSVNQTDFKLILKQLDSLKSEQAKLIDLVNKQNGKLDSFEQKLSEVSSKLFSIKEENNQLRNNLNTLTKRVESLEANQSTPNEDTFSDFIDRQARAKNIILFSVPEAIGDNSDTSTVNLIFQKLQVNVQPVTAHRLGKPNGKIRPLKVTLNSTSDVFKILGSSRHLKSDQILGEVRITSDKTPKQREYFQNLRKELNNRRSNGESNLTIKYIKGVPSISSSNVQKN